MSVIEEIKYPSGRVALHVRSVADEIATVLIAPDVGADEEPVYFAVNADIAEALGKALLEFAAQRRADAPSLSAAEQRFIDAQFNPSPLYEAFKAKERGDEGS